MVDDYQFTKTCRWVANINLIIAWLNKGLKPATTIQGGSI